MVEILELSKSNPKGEVIAKFVPENFPLGARKGDKFTINEEVFVILNSTTNPVKSTVTLECVSEDSIDDAITEVLMDLVGADSSKLDEILKKLKIDANKRKHE
tara:strand:+ start:69259 stop:69567 length:309 start_codon:yes stop_codon:yes gene_type:complete